MSSSQHFPPNELACHHCSKNFATPEIVAALESIRSMLPPLAKDKPSPLYVIDCCRCLDWNLRVPNSASHSEHMLGRAADIRAPGLTAAQLLAYALKVPSIQGIGRNDSAGWIHVDVRPERARWCYNTAGVVVPWFDPPSPAPGGPIAA